MFAGFDGRLFRSLSGERGKRACGGWTSKGQGGGLGPLDSWGGLEPKFTQFLIVIAIAQRFRDLRSGLCEGSILGPKTLRKTN